MDAIVIVHEEMGEDSDFNDAQSEPRSVSSPSSTKTTVPPTKCDKATNTGPNPVAYNPMGDTITCPTCGNRTIILPLLILKDAETQTPAGYEPLLDEKIIQITPKPSNEYVIPPNQTCCDLMIDFFHCACPCL